MTDLRDLSMVIALSLTIAVLGYSIQFIFFVDWFLQQSIFVRHSFRFSRMLLGYIVPSLFYLKRKGKPISELGIGIEGSQIFLVSFSLGILLYLVPSYIFAHFEIFTTQWRDRMWLESLLLLILIGGMAAITDLWTRGFVLIQVEGIKGALPAIFAQNLIWFTIHIYEIVALTQFIGVYGAILLTLFLGIGGDLIVLRYRNVVGLMVGHIVLNLFIILQGKAIIQF